MSLHDERAPRRADHRTPLRRYVYVVGRAGLGGAAPVAVRARSTTPQPLVWLLFGALAVLTGTLTTKVASVPVTMSVSDTFFIAAVMLFGAGPATIVVAIASGAVSWRRRHTVAALRLQHRGAGSLDVDRRAGLLRAAGVPPLAAGTPADPARHRSAARSGRRVFPAQHGTDRDRGRPRYAARRRSSSGGSTSCGWRSAFSPRRPSRSA